MSISLVQAVTTGTASSGSTLPLTVTSTGAGNLLIIFFAANGSGATLSSVTDNVSNNYIRLARVDSGSNLLVDNELWYAWNAIAGATTITAHIGSPPTNCNFTLLEYSGAKTSATPSDIVNSFSKTTGTPVGASITPSAAGELLISCTCIYSPTNFTGVQSPWTWSGLSTTFEPQGIATYINAPLSSQAPAYNPTTSTTFNSITASFLSAAPPIVRSSGMFAVL